MTRPFSMGITFPMDIMSGTDEKSIFPGQMFRYAIRIIYMYEKIDCLCFTIKDFLRNKK